MVEGIPGSSPNWRGANMKTKGRCQPTDVPESRLGGTAAGLAAWGTGSPDAQRETRYTNGRGNVLHNGFHLIAQSSSLCMIVDAMGHLSALLRPSQMAVWVRDSYKHLCEDVSA
jgi:hypothetical protein